MTIRIEQGESSFDVYERYMGCANLQDLYDMKYPEDKHPNTLKLEREPKKKIKHRSIKPDQLLISKFNEFLNSGWKFDWYSPSDFNDIFGINRHLARYYLLNMMFSGKLFRIKYLNKTFFVKKTSKFHDISAEEYFRGFIWIGVEISSRNPHTSSHKKIT